MADYYSEHLAGERLRRCYEIAPARTRQYLDAEIRHVAGCIRPTDTVLELGCGYGRVMENLADGAKAVVGIDTSRPSLELGRKLLGAVANCSFVQMNAATLGFRDSVFDVVLCIQNGLSAFKVEQSALIVECIRVARGGGTVLLSSYAQRFWEHRLEWFELQAEHGLLGELDGEATGDGVIVCKDGFRATTITPEQFESLTAGLDVRRHIREVDESSVFCELTALDDAVRNDR